MPFFNQDRLTEIESKALMVLGYGYHRDGSGCLSGLRYAELGYRALDVYEWGVLGYTCGGVCPRLLRLAMLAGMEQSTWALIHTAPIVFRFNQ